MLVSLGQQRGSRDPARSGDPLLPAPDEELPAETLVTSEIIAGLIAHHYESSMQYSRVTSIRLADGQIRPDQKFYDREIEITAQILAARSPTTETAENWYLLMKNYMGYRIRPVPFCSYGAEPDPVTRECVVKRAEPPPGIPQPEPQPEITRALLFPLGIVGIIFLVMLGGNK